MSSDGLPQYKSNIFKIANCDVQVCKILEVMKWEARFGQEFGFPQNVLNSFQSNQNLLFPISAALRI